MKVHVVCCNLHEDKVLPRLAHALARGNNWTLSEMPDADADLNYFIVYIDYVERLVHWHKTPIAAYFSHYDPDDPHRKGWWRDAEKLVDVRVVTSRIALEHLDNAKPYFVATPPVSRQFFPKKVRREGNRIGVSGFVTRNSDRKGVLLLVQLRQMLEGRYEMVASGVGWPLPSRLYSFGELVAYYQSLDVLLCTSSIEGIPMPPLEALACGTPVVIPQGVGLLDDLRGMPGVYTYDRRHPRDITEKIEEAMYDRHTPDEIHETIARYTPEKWCEDHNNGFTHLAF